MRKKGFTSIRTKFRNISLALMVSLVAAFGLMQCLNGWMQAENRKIFQDYGGFPEFWNKIQEADRVLYSYAQTPVESSRDQHHLLLEELSDGADVLSRTVERPEMEDLRRLTEKYTEMGEDILFGELDTQERIQRYNQLNEYKWIMEGLYDTLYQQMQEYLGAKLEEQDRIKNGINLITVLVEAGIVMFLFWWNRRLAGQIMQPVLELTAQTEQMAQGNRRIEMRYHENIGDELDVLNNSFYRMVEANNRSYDSLQRQHELEQELSRAQVENAHLQSTMDRTKLRLLQSRVNPHFMFNTLNLIAGMALEEDAGKTTEMVMQTAKYLRYALICLDKAVRLEEELENALDYLNIQKGRFEERFQVSVCVEERCRMAVVPSMILQPLCENALEYGMSPLNRTTCIEIKAIEKEGQLQLSVEDDGAGMTKERLREIRERLSGVERYDDTQGIGIANTFYRLKTFYRTVCGEQGKVDVLIESVPLVRTRICFQLPFADLPPAQAQKMMDGEETEE